MSSLDIDFLNRLKIATELKDLFDSFSDLKGLPKVLSRIKDESMPYPGCGKERLEVILLVWLEAEKYLKIRGVGYSVSGYKSGGMDFKEPAELKAAIDTWNKKAIRLLDMDKQTVTFRFFLTEVDE